ncbi:hypothetical protein ACTWPT_58750 [Nonomuraea sp. 3N208]|uniref:hypothetical protein n=1 Tax=Nonomuraea sp. 3N208 TaxID=3457421 RepID=UPI003FD05123
MTVLQISGKSLAISTIVVLSVLSALAGLAVLGMTWLWGEKSLEVDPRAVRQVEEIGHVTAQTESRFVESGTIVVTKYLILDFRIPDAGKALNEASRLLQEKGWGIVAKLQSGGVEMESEHWPHHLLTIENPEDTYLSLNRDLERALSDAQAKARYPDALVVLRLRRMDV